MFWLLGAAGGSGSKGPGIGRAASPRSLSPAVVNIGTSLHGGRRERDAVPGRAGGSPLEETVR